MSKFLLQDPSFYLDMDGVLVNFDKLFRQVMPVEDHHEDFEWEKLHDRCPNIYLDAEPMPDAFVLWDYVSRYGSPEILTAIPKRWSWPNVTDHKRDWIHYQFGPHINVKFGPYAKDKQWHCKRSTDVLIDDKQINIDQWNARGGVGILHTNAGDTIRQLKELGW